MQPQDMKAIPAAKIIQSAASTAIPSSDSSFLAPDLFNRARAKNIPDRMSQAVYVAGEEGGDKFSRCARHGRGATRRGSPDRGEPRLAVETLAMPRLWRRSGQEALVTARHFGIETKSG
jgi:hypothetical protein